MRDAHRRKRSVRSSCHLQQTQIKNLAIHGHPVSQGIYNAKSEPLVTAARHWRPLPIGQDRGEMIGENASEKGNEVSIFRQFLKSLEFRI